MEKGIKNLTQAARSKKKGTGHHEDSGIGISDLDEDDRSTPIDGSVDPTSFAYQHPYPTHHQHQRVPSIQSILQTQPTMHHAAYQTHHPQHQHQYHPQL
jgi:hypothetical protein